MIHQPSIIKFSKITEPLMTLIRKRRDQVAMNIGWGKWTLACLFHFVAVASCKLQVATYIVATAHCSCSAVDLARHRHRLKRCSSQHPLYRVKWIS